MLNRVAEGGIDLVTLLIAARWVIYKKRWGRYRCVSLSLSLLNSNNDDEFFRKFWGEYEAGARGRHKKAIENYNTRPLVSLRSKYDYRA